MRVILDAVVTAGIASVGATAMAACLGCHDGARVTASVNAVSRIIWGERSVRHQRPSMRYTLAGAALHYAGCLFWAAVAEGWQRSRPLGRPAAALRRGVALAASAYLVDQWLLPDRWRPGYRRILSSPQVVAVYATLAISLPLRAWLVHRRAQCLAPPAASANLARTETTNRLSSTR